LIVSTEREPDGHGAEQERGDKQGLKLLNGDGRLLWRLGIRAHAAAYGDLDALRPREDFKALVKRHGFVGEDHNAPGVEDYSRDYSYYSRFLINFNTT